LIFYLSRQPDAPQEILSAVSSPSRRIEKNAVSKSDMLPNWRVIFTKNFFLDKLVIISDHILPVFSSFENLQACLFCFTLRLNTWIEERS
jgi:hypothetical protein